VNIILQIFANYCLHIRVWCAIVLGPVLKLQTDLVFVLVLGLEWLVLVLVLGLECMVLGLVLGLEGKVLVNITVCLCLTSLPSE